MAARPMDLGLEGKVALVTAASNGLGLACAEHLAAAGCKIAICARRADRVEAAADRIREQGVGDVLGVEADLRDAHAGDRLMQAVLDRFGGLDILVANSGHVAYGGLEELSEADWYHAFELLLMSAVRLTRLAIPVMRRAGGGDIVFLSSATMREPPADLLLSTVMRLGALGLAKSLAHATAADDIRVNTIAPGYFDTGRVRERRETLMAEYGLSGEEAASRITGDIPLGRMGTAAELAALVAFVVSRRAGFMTGATIAIDGGKGRALP